MVFGVELVCAGGKDCWIFFLGVPMCWLGYGWR